MLVRLRKDTIYKKQQNQALTQLLTEACLTTTKRAYHVFIVDCTSNPRVYSPTLADRSFVYAPNAITGNKPITIGHQYSIAAYLPEKREKQSPPWIVPLSCQRTSTDQKNMVLGMKQIAHCIQTQDVFKNALCISVGDCAYSHPNCLAEANKNQNQIHLCRVRNNRKFYYPLSKRKTLHRRGRPKRYDKVHHLAQPTSWKKPDETIEFEMISKKGKLKKVIIQSWNEMIMGGNRNVNVSDCAFRLISVCLYQADGKRIFKRPLWLIASGKRHEELSLREIFDIYCQRFDIEHSFRFGKDRLLMDKLQTPDIDHAEAWWQLVMVAV